MLYVIGIAPFNQRHAGPQTWGHPRVYLHIVGFSSDRRLLDLRCCPRRA